MINSVKSLEEQRLANPLKNKQRMSCMNAIALIDYFTKQKGASAGELAAGLFVDEAYLRDPDNQLNNLDTYRLYYNCQHSIPGFTHKDWFYVGQHVFRTTAPGYFKALIKILPLKTVYAKIPQFNNQTSKVSSYRIIESGEGRIVYRFTIPKEIQDWFSIGSETWYHLGILSAMPRIQNRFFPFSGTRQFISAFPAGHILINCYDVAPERISTTENGVLLDTIEFGQWVNLAALDLPIKDLVKKEICRDEEGLLITKDVIIQRKTVFENGEIYGAPFSLFEVKYAKHGLLERFINRASDAIGI